LIRAAQIGAQHTELKRSIVESYLESFTRALKPRFKQLWHIDAFAGRVSRTVRVEARKGDLFDAPAPERVAPRICSDCYRRRIKA
jgi:hypothetical protein